MKTVILFLLSLFSAGGCLLSDPVVQVAVADERFVLLNKLAKMCIRDSDGVTPGEADGAETAHDGMGNELGIRASVDLKHCLLYTSKTLPMSHVWIVEVWI